MNKKNISILTLAIIIVIGSVGFVVWKMEQKKSITIKTTQEKNNIDSGVPENNVPKDNVTTDHMTKEQSDFANKFKQDMEQKTTKNDMLSFFGAVQNIGIGGKGITIRNNDGSKTSFFQIDANTKIFQLILDKNNKQIQSEIKLDDIKSGDIVDVNFAPMTNKAIFLVKH